MNNTDSDYIRSKQILTFRFDCLSGYKIILYEIKMLFLHVSLITLTCPYFLQGLQEGSVAASCCFRSRPNQSAVGGTVNYTDPRVKIFLLSFCWYFWAKDKIKKQNKKNKNKNNASVTEAHRSSSGSGGLEQTGSIYPHVCPKQELKQAFLLFFHGCSKGLK